MARWKDHLMWLVLLTTHAYGLPRRVRQADLDISEAELAKGCSSNPADIVFVLDESGSIWGPDFDKQLQFVKSVVDIFDIGPDKTQIGVLTFSDDAMVRFEMDDFETGGGIVGAISLISQRRGGTNTALAIRTMLTDMFSPSHSRKGVSKIGIIITDGESENRTATGLEALAAKQDPDTPLVLFAVGVGKGVNTAELNSIASKPASEYVYTVTGYDALDALKTNLAWRACQVSTEPPPTTTPEATTTTTPEPTTTSTPEPTTTPAPEKTTTLPQMVEGCTGRGPADIVFTLPDQAGIADTNFSLEFIKRVLETASVSPGKMRAGLAPRNCFGIEEIRLKDNDNIEVLKEDLDRRKFSSVALTETLDYLTDVAFSPANGGREEAAKFAILLVDNRVEDLEDVQLKVEGLKAEGVHVLLVGIEPFIDSAELYNMASSVGDVIIVDSYHALAHSMTFQDDVNAWICRGIMEEGPPC